ncbi:Cytokinesis protein sepH [Smittium mucronatum]|uniref:Cytokinesis protein sepH n=1 Tax=Smittium mucronatum TaxID=133383 RepID=A0A1R0H096_9FUNG|nr:Cytokinesis protein sepH [Smittium mucronatum]
MSQEHRIIGKYQLGDCIGKGAYGAVYRALNIHTGKVVAIKQVITSGDDSSEIIASTKHPNIVKYYGCEQTARDLNIILEYCEGGSLQSVVSKFGQISEKLVGVFTYQTLCGLSYLHSKEIIHRDIKAANLLYTKSGVVKLSDFGTSRLYDGKQTMAGSPYWVAPEVITMNGSTRASDIWSLGCTVIQLFTGEAPFQKLSVPSALFHMVNEDRPPLPPNSSPVFFYSISCRI